MRARRVRVGSLADMPTSPRHVRFPPITWLSVYEYADGQLKISLGVSGFCGLRLFAKTFDVGFGLIGCLVDLFADLGDALVLSSRLYVDDQTRSVGSTDDPPIRESRITRSDEKNGCQKNPMQH
jgi:hypothetical protein